MCKAPSVLALAVVVAVGCGGATPGSRGNGGNGGDGPDPTAHADMSRALPRTDMSASTMPAGDMATVIGARRDMSSTCTSGACFPDPCHAGTIVCVSGAASCEHVQQRPDGSSCGTNMVCSSGDCVACSAGDVCNAGPCLNAQIECNTGQPVCVATSMVADGTPCGTDHVCDWGECIACTQGAACVPRGTCINGTLDCTKGKSTCIPTSGTAPNGSYCDNNSYCYNGTCDVCYPGYDCSDPMNPCKVGKTSCTTGLSTCAITGNAPDGKLCSTSGPAMCCHAGSCGGCP